MRNDILNKQSEIEIWIKENKSKAFICKKLRCKQSTLNVWLKKMNIEYKGTQSWSKDRLFKNKYVLAVQHLFNGSIITPSVLKERLFRDGIREKKCETCGNIEWNGFDIPLQLHHIDGDRHNNELSNLKILCPNCHAQTDTYCGKNVKQITQKYPRKIKNYCSCGNEKNLESKTCFNCYNKNRQRKVQNIPNKEELIIMIKETSLEAVGRKYGVSGNAAKKWLK